MVPRVPDCLLLPPDPEQLLSRILESRPQPARRASLPAPQRRQGAPAPHRPSPPDSTALVGTSEHRWQPGRRRGTMIAAVAAVALVVALVAAEGSRAQPAAASTIPSLSYGVGDLAKSSLDELPDASATLRGLADAARETPEPVRTGTVQHVVAQEWLGETGPAPDGSGQATSVYPTVTERWLAADGSGLITQRRAAAVTYDGAINTEAGPSLAGELSSDAVLPGTFDDVARLPEDPAALAADILGRSSAECSLDDWKGYCLTEQVQTYFGSGVVPQDLTGAFWDMLAQQPTVRLLGPTTDRAGREGTAVAVEAPKIPEDPSDDESVLVLIVSEETGQLLATETLTLRSDLLGVTSPTVTGFSAITLSEYTTEVGR
ncbi:CU044_5270 family protein [Sanguibacter sp. Leaf3]|uniref:CU044_5270 family protein n=1 Tax=Sanguibacter sp. Leaf3 TaxID=1736209 RepID=UPI0022863B71|nr:CU044_5270 family protein [Sanguibacter sp. Leaf3]